jgi:hypothetical protein
MDEQISLGIPTYRDNPSDATEKNYNPGYAIVSDTGDSTCH